MLSNDEKTPTWTETYDDGRVSQPDVGTSVRYLYAVYWAVTTLTTVGYGDLVPTNDAERGYALMCPIDGLPEGGDVVVKCANGSDTG